MLANFTLNAIEGIIVGIISLPFVIVIHELGHLLFGKLSGYQFISLRLVLFQWARDKDGKIKFTRATSLFGVGGQCLMNPTGEEKDFRYKLYNLGGSLANIITGVIFLIPIFLFGHILARWLFIAGAVSVFMALANLIPSASGGFPNDGRNVKEAKKSEDAKNGFFRMLKANGEMALGKHLSDFDEDFFKFNDEVDVNNFLVSHAILLHAAYLEEKEDYKKSYEKLLFIEDAKVPSIYKAQIVLALLFNELIHQSTDDALERAKERWKQVEKDKELRDIFETKHPGFMIPYAAKVAFIDLEPKAARKLLAEGEKLIPRLQNPGTEHLAKLMVEHLNQRLPKETPKKPILADESKTQIEKSDGTLGDASQEKLEEAVVESSQEKSDETVEESPQEKLEDTMEQPPEKPTEEIHKETPEEPTEEVHEETPEERVEKSTEKPIEEDTGESPEELLEESIEESTQKLTEESTEEPTEEPKVSTEKSAEKTQEEIYKPKSAVEILENMRMEVAKAVLFEDTAETSDTGEITEENTEENIEDTTEVISDDATEDTEVDNSKNFDNLMEQFRKRR